MTNFAFLKPQFPDLAETAIGAESLIYIHPAAAIVMARQSLEMLVFWLYEHDKTLIEPFDAKLHNLLNEPTFITLLPDYVWEKMDIIRRQGNKIAHTNPNQSQKTANKTQPSNAQNIIEQLFLIYNWFERHYGNTAKQVSATTTVTTARRFKDDLVPSLSQSNDNDKLSLEALQKQNQLFEKQLAEQHEQLKHYQETLQERSSDVLGQQQLLTQLNAELAQKRAEIEQIKAQNLKQLKTQPDTTDYLESDTRKLYIDLLLEEAGWNFDKNIKTEYKVTNFPANKSGEGFVDYVLMGDNGLPLAIVEAKRTAISPEAGKQQAKLYADSLTEMTGQRPIIFYSNGYQTYIWNDLGDINGKGGVPRSIQGFYSPQELSRLIERRKNNASSENSLSKININKSIAERYYQTRAIQSLITTFEQGNRKGLLIMATGTGKTRTAIALVDVLMRANVVQKVLFLADRTSLVRQATNNFKQFLPDTAPINLVENRNQVGRVYLSTYQTMMGLIDEKDENGVNRFGVGMFDLVIIDEAHRSVYQKYGQIFRYFDSRLVGLTATPRDEVDRDTYQLFGLPSGVPTDYYSLEQAIADGYLVPPKAFSVPLKFVREGIKYDELSETEKHHWESLDWGDQSPPEEVTASQINKMLFNQDTIDKMLQHLMENGIKVEGGDRLGKTIIFAANQKHAEYIAERFNHHYPQYNGQFARIITHAVSFSQTLIDDFSKKDNPAPQIAISVDMLDTGIDIPEVVNLVFFKALRSKVKFLQMIGRGTRLCKDLFAPNRDKKEFYIFDYCGNFEYFNENPEGAIPTASEPLSERLFKARLRILQLLSSPSYAKSDKSAMQHSFKQGLWQDVAGMNTDNFIVRTEWHQVDYFKKVENWENLSLSDIGNLQEHIAKLPTEHDPDKQANLRNSIEAKLFDMLCYDLVLSILPHPELASDIINLKSTKRIIEITQQLEQKSNIPAVAHHLSLIQEIQTPDYWQDIHITCVEEIRNALRGLVALLDKSDRTIIYSLLDDEIGEHKVVDVPEVGTGVDIAQYRKQVENFIKVNENQITIAKLKRGSPLTPMDIATLEDFIFHADTVGSKETFLKCYGDSLSLPVFIRSLIGLDRQAVQQAFSQYLTDSNYNEKQIRFIEMVIEQLTKQGIMQSSRLYESPFNQIHYEGIDGIFSEKDTDEIFEIINHFNQLTA